VPDFRAPTDGTITRREDETWKIIGAFVIAFALMTALLMVL